MSVLFSDSPVAGIVPREYQRTDVEESFRLWDSGTVGALTRIFTGGGKTISTCLKFRQWLDRGDDYRCMVLSYEQQLVWQFAEEIEDVLHLTPGIEMGSQEIEPGRIPQIVVACRQSLLPHKLISVEQQQVLANYGLTDVGLLTMSAAKRAIMALQKGADVQDIADGIASHNDDYRASQETRRFSRLHKFDWRLNWLICFDEAHKYATKHVSCGHLIEWFERNPNSRRSGVTATPKRSDNVSIGAKLFPGVAIDYPFRDAVRDGYAVPYVQKFIQVEGVDFKRLKEESRGSQEKWDAGLAAALDTEEQIAKLCQPLLDLVGERRTLIFSPSVAMAQHVAAWINARSECECSCGTKRWYANQLINDGAKCGECGEWIVTANVVKGGLQAHCVHGEIQSKQRREIYKQHQTGKFQFLSICSLCKEGYNDRDIACVAIFRPVSKAAASLAEQMKGRGSRPLKGCIDGLDTVAERVAAIQGSSKPDCLIVDLVGVSGLSECASTVQIYADGLPDEIVKLAEEINLTGGVPDPRAAIEEAKRQHAEQKEKQRIERENEQLKRREEAERRARLQAEVRYSVHETGSQSISRSADPSMATENQLKCIHMLGMDFVGWLPSKKQAGRIITQLKEDKKPPEEVAYLNRITTEQWIPSHPSVKQIRYMTTLGIRGANQMTPAQASEAISRAKNPGQVAAGVVVDVAKRAIDSARNADELTAAAKRIMASKSDFTDAEFASVVAYGKAARERLTETF